MGLKPQIVEAGGICSFFTNNYVTLVFDCIIFFFLYKDYHVWQFPIVFPLYSKISFGILGDVLRELKRMRKILYD
jgi:hypothetical protein